MSNPNPPTDHLHKVRGKRPQLNHERYSFRMSPQTRHNLSKIAESFDILRGQEPWVGGLLQKIGDGELMVVHTPPFFPTKNDE